jgi:hypothetical protein
MYIVNGKSDQGPNPEHLASATPSLTRTTYPGGNDAANTASNASNQYQLQLHRSALVSLPVPALADWYALTAQVAANNFYSVPQVASDKKMMAFLHDHIRHVIYVIKENRTYDQVLGDLGNGANGDPSLAVFGRGITPNFHRLATRFVTLDNFFDPGDASMNGWSWSTQADATDQAEKAQQVNYAGRGVSYDTEGDMRNVDIGLDLATREQVQPAYAAAAAALPGGEQNLLPGPANVARIDGPNGLYQGGLLWEAALRAGLTVRNYGFWVGTLHDAPALTVRNPYANGTPVSYGNDATLYPITDPYYRGYNNAYSDVWRLEEWQREFANYEQVGNLPALELVRLSHDHMGNFATAVGGFNTPETQQADNDLAVGRLVETVAHSKKYADNTLIFVVEDDPQDGPDHIDSHRSTAYVVGPYVRHRAVISTRYTTVNLIRTMEDVLGIGYLNLNDALQRPMADVFDRDRTWWSYEAVASTVLKSAQAAITPADGNVQYAEGPDLVPKHDAAYWEEATEGFDFSEADRVPYDRYNRVLWEGLTGGKPYPARPSGAELRTIDEAALAVDLRN